VRFGDAFDAEVLGRGGPDGSLFHLRFPADPLTLLARHGHVPLPPYIPTPTRPRTSALPDRVRRPPGAVAAPTAALHFDEPLLQALQARGVGTRA
jgi:S-adenosylmethionine:tRNA ribosyltransferase-isomerase